MKERLTDWLAASRHWVWVCLLLFQGIDKDKGGLGCLWQVPFQFQDLDWSIWIGMLAFLCWVRHTGWGGLFLTFKQKSICLTVVEQVQGPSSPSSFCCLALFPVEKRIWWKDHGIWYKAAFRYSPEHIQVSFPFLVEFCFRRVGIRRGGRLNPCSQHSMTLLGICISQQDHEDQQ